MEETTLSQAVKRCEELTRVTGKQYYFKGNKGNIELTTDKTTQ